MTAAVAYATGPVMIKLALEQGMSVAVLLFGRMVIAAGVLAGFAALRDRDVLGPRARGGDALGALLLGALGYGAQLALFSLALERIGASLVVILFNVFPIMVAIVAALTGRDPLTARRVIALALGVAGVALVALVDGELRAEPLGIAMALGSGAACAAVVLGGDVLGDRVPPLRQAAFLTAGASVAFTVGVLLVGFEGGGNAEAWVLTLGIALIPGVLGFVTMLDSVGRVGPSFTSILMTLEPPVTVVLAWVSLGERLTAAQFAGGAIILAAVVLARQTVQHDVEIEPPS